MSRIPSADVGRLDVDTRSCVERAQVRGVPSPAVAVVMAHAPAILQSFDHYWQGVVASGAVESKLKELLRIHIANSLGAVEVLGPEDPLVRRADLDASPDKGRFSEREKAALAYADAIVWGPASGSDDMWDALHREFTEPEIVELSVVIALFSGGQRWIRTLGLDRVPATMQTGSNTG